MQKKIEPELHKEEHQEQSVGQKEKDEQKEQCQPADRQIQGVTIFCPICKDYISHSVTTSCEHTFCQLCLQEYLIYIDECPECRVKIRNQKFANNILLDNLILDYVKRFQKEEFQQYEKKLEDYKTYKKKRTVGELETGAVVDVRDPDYVWCTGKVHRTVNKFHDKKVKYVIIKYDKGTKKEEMPQNSPRLAPKGFFTEREDIPRYERGKLILRNPEQGVCYLISKQSEDEDEERKGEAEQ